MQPRVATRPSVMAAAFLVGLACVAGLLTGCETIEGGVAGAWEGPDYEGRILPTSSAQGARALENWRKLDLDTRKYLETHRAPDYVLAESQFVMKFFYVKENVVVTFDRPVLGVTTKISAAPIPPDIRRALR